MIASILLTASASIVGLLGFLHLVLTFRGPKLLPRDPSLRAAMDSVAPVITKQTTIWRMWIGFNVSHSMGAMLFGLVYGYLPWAGGNLLFESIFLQAVGLAMLGGFATSARLYWFKTPFLGASLSLLLYIAGLLVGRLA